MNYMKKTFSFPAHLFYKSLVFNENNLLKIRKQFDQILKTK